MTILYIYLGDDIHDKFIDQLIQSRRTTNFGIQL